MLAACALAAPATPALADGSVDINLGPGTAGRQALSGVGPAGGQLTWSPLSVYARAGETIQLASSLMGLPNATIRVFAPGADRATDTPLLDCAASQPGRGRINTRAEELAGPLPNAGGYSACELVAPVDGIYPVVFVGTAEVNGAHGTVDAPVTDETQGANATMWDVTVRSLGVVQPGRLFAPRLTLRVGSSDASDVQAYVYTRTGYEYQVNFYDHAGINWILTADDRGVYDSRTGERTFASFACGDDQPDNNQCQFSDATTASNFDNTDDFERAYALFVRRPDPIVISGPGGLAEVYGYATAPITPASRPLSALTFTGAAGETGATSRGAGGTIAFSSPTAMAGLGYTIAIDIDRDGTFGNGPDVVDDSRDLAANGSNAFAWDGLDARGGVPQCGDYTYQVRSTLSEVHFTQNDVENSGGIRIERLSLPDDPALGHPLAASYDNRDPYKGGYVVTNGAPAFATNAISGPGFNSWSLNTGNTDYIDTWARLPEISVSGTLRVLCSDLEIVKTSTPSPMVPGTDQMFRLTVTNRGPDAATGVVVTDQLPSDITFRSASAGCVEAGGTVTCTLPSLAAGATHTFEIVGTVDSGVETCLHNTARVSSAVYDPDTTNNSSSTCVPIRGKVDLSVRKVPSRTSLPPSGGQVIYTLVVRNDGPSDDTGVIVTDELPAGLTLVSAQPSQGSCSTDGNVVSCRLGNLRAGGTAQVLVTANASGAPGPITNTVSVRGAKEDTDPSDNVDRSTITIEQPPGPGDPQFDLVVDKTANVRSPVIGQPVRYRITVTNRGPDAAPNVRLTDTINAPVTVRSVKATQGRCRKGNPIDCQLGTIAAGKSVTVTAVIVHREAGKGQRNAASAVGEGTDTNPSNNLDTVTRKVGKVPLRLAKSASKAVVRAGETFTYKLRVSNPSGGVARNVSVCDRLPAGIVYVRSKPRARVVKGQHCWKIGKLGPRASKTLSVTVRALRGTSGNKVNRAVARSPDGKTARAKRAVRVVGGEVAAGGVTG